MKSPREIAAAIEHTLLRPEATPEQIDEVCDQAMTAGFAGVCVNPIYVRRAAARLEGQNPGAPVVVSVVGFPLGANLSATKVDEARRAIDNGACEIDAVISIGSLLAGDVKSVRREIEDLAQVVHGEGRRLILKIILETAALTREQIIAGCRCCAEGGTDFVKTSTGFHASGGATVEHVRLLHRHVAPIRVKAAGGIRTAADALAMLGAGASRIGTSSGLSILKELESPIG